MYPKKVKLIRESVHIHSPSDPEFVQHFRFGHRSAHSKFILIVDESHSIDKS